jgi:hypothetical protein
MYSGTNFSEIWAGAEIDREDRMGLSGLHMAALIRNEASFFFIFFHGGPDWSVGFAHDSPPSATRPLFFLDMAALMRNESSWASFLILKSPLYGDFLHGKYARTLTFENFCQKRPIRVSKEGY